MHYVGSGFDKGEGCNLLLASVVSGPGGNIAWTPMDDDFDVAVQGSERLAMPSNPAVLRERLVKRFPAEAEAIDAYFAAVREGHKSGALYFVSKIVCGFLPQKLADVVRRRLSSAFFRISDQTTEQALDRITKNAELRGLLTYHWGNYGLPPRSSSWAAHCMVANHYLDGARFPTGGSSQLALRIIPGRRRPCARTGEQPAGGGWPLLRRGRQAWRRRDG